MHVRGLGRMGIGGGQETASDVMAKSAAGQLALPPRPSLAEQLDFQKRELENRLADVTAALDALKANPDVEKVLELLSRV
jgi:hypothetical protein